MRGAREEGFAVDVIVSGSVMCFFEPRKGLMLETGFRKAVESFRALEDLSIGDCGRRLATRAVRQCELNHRFDCKLDTY